MTEPTRDALHAETLAMLADEESMYRAPVKSVYPEQREAVAAMYAYAAECVQRVPELEAWQDDNRRAIIAATARCLSTGSVPSGAQSLEDAVIAVCAEVERLRAKAAVVDAINAGEVEQMSGWGNADGPMKFGVRLKGSGPMDFGFGATMQAAYEGALAAYAAATREGTDNG